MWYILKTFKHVSLVSEEYMLLRIAIVFVYWYSFNTIVACVQSRCLVYHSVDQTEFIASFIKKYFFKRCTLTSFLSCFRFTMSNTQPKQQTTRSRDSAVSSKSTSDHAASYAMHSQLAAHEANSMVKQEGVSLVGANVGVTAVLTSVWNDIKKVFE